MINGDAAFDEEFFDVSVGKAVAELDSDRRTEVLDLLNASALAEVDVILDIVHLSGSEATTTGYAIPDWAWDTTDFTANSQRTKANSWEAWAGDDNSGANVEDYIDELSAAGILTHNAVIAVEVVNEPHPPNTDAEVQTGQDDLAEVYSNLIDHIRTKDSEMMVIVGAFFGGLRHGGVVTNDEFNFNSADDLINQPNVVWTAHNYYTGVGDTLGDNDGQQHSTQPRGMSAVTRFPIASARGRMTRSSVSASGIEPSDGVHKTKMLSWLPASSVVRIVRGDSQLLPTMTSHSPIVSAGAVPCSTARSQVSLPELTPMVRPFSPSPTVSKMLQMNPNVSYVDAS